MRTHRWHCASLAFTLVSTLVIPTYAQAVTDAEVVFGIREAVQWLRKHQNAPGGWEAVPAPVLNAGKNDSDPDGLQWGSTTALIAEICANSGEALDQEGLKAHTFLDAAQLQGFRAIVARAAATDATGSQAPRRWSDADLKSLRSATEPALNFQGFFSWKENAPANPATYTPVLTARTAELLQVLWRKKKLQLPANVWLTMDRAWRRTQLPDGSWPATPDGKKGDLEATAAGVTGLLICAEMAAVDNVGCNANPPDPDLQRAMAWLDRIVPDQFLSALRTMTAVGRVGLRTGRTHFGKLDWLAVGTASLLVSQRPDGSWGDAISTALAVEFLTANRPPSFVMKLASDPKKNSYVNPTWNERPFDLHAFGSWLGPTLCFPTSTLRVVDLTESIEELSRTRVIYLSGSSDFSIAAADQVKLREFVYAGGLILGNADCGSEAFARSFVTLGRQLFPHYAFRTLPPEHPIITAQQYFAKKWKVRPTLQGLSNGVREWMLLFPDHDPAESWNGQRPDRNATAFQVGANIVLYAVDLSLYPTRSRYNLAAPVPPVLKVLKLARLQVGDNWDPEPNAWKHFGEMMLRECHVQVDATPVPLNQAAIAPFSIAHLTGTDSLLLTDVDRQELARFVNNGGTLIVDAAGGDTQFAASAEAALRKVFAPPAQAGFDNPIPKNAPIYTMNGLSLVAETSLYRPVARRFVPNWHEPHLRAMDIGGRPAVFFSSEDLTAGIGDIPTGGIIGYNARYASRLLRNLVLFGSFGQNVPAAFLPAVPPGVKQMPATKPG